MLSINEILPRRKGILLDYNRQKSTNSKFQNIVNHHHEPVALKSCHFVALGVFSASSEKVAFTGDLLGHSPIFNPERYIFKRELHREVIGTP